MKALFVDMDGTLLTSDKRISDEDLKSINEMTDKGHYVVINTGRPLYSVLLLLEEYGLIKKNVYVSSFNGGLLYDPVNKKKLLYHSIENEDVRYLLDAAEKAGIHAHTYSDTHVLSKYDTKPLQFYTKRIRMPALITEDFEKELTDKPPKVILITLDDREVLEKFREDNKAYTDGRLYATFSDARLLEYANPKVSKGAAVKFMCEYLGISKEDAVAAGDEENDVPMFKEAAVGVCMKNGSDIAKENADFITERSCDENGVSEIIKKYFI